MFGDLFRPRALVLAVLSTLLVGLGLPPGAAEDLLRVERRLARSTQYLSSDELEGRGIGTRGLDKAADFAKDNGHTLESFNRLLARVRGQKRRANN